ncbi:MAG: CDP-diacylglycerol--serine O-phosphatidyltransferase [Acidobacteria bacterium]|nr:CDP-diacylglycerol--serine O-phosphatidyltransferase [Acidobacteriota bacterium]
MSLRERRPRRPRPRHPGPEQLRRGIYVIPSLFTVGNMLAGFAAVLHAIEGRLELAGMLIILAGILDGLDGRIARLTNSTSEFGKEYDSLADVVSFGVAPAILAYQWGLRGMGRWGWLVAFLFVVAGSVRLARFNVKSAHGDRRYFTGLPIPGGAGALTLMVLCDPDPVLDARLTYAVWGFVLLISVLMVSTVPYRSFKDFNLRRRWPATTFFFIALVVGGVAVAWFPTMALALGIYLVAGPVEYAVRRFAKKPNPPPLSSAEVPSAPAHPENP